MPPEMVQTPTLVSYKTDVYSMGLVILVIASQVLPWNTINLNTIIFNLHENMVPDARKFNISDPLLLDFLMLCIKPQRLDRASLETLAQHDYLKQEQETVQNLVKLDIDIESSTSDPLLPVLDDKPNEESQISDNVSTCCNLHGFFKAFLPEDGFRSITPWNKGI